MRIQITTAQELGAILGMTSKKQRNFLSGLVGQSEIRLLFVVDRSSHTTDIDFDSMLKSLADNGFRLTAEVEIPLQRKNKSRNVDRRKTTPKA